jgi:uncharacterized damage-inducible protein DinB
VPSLARLFAYDAWANAEALSSIRAAGAPRAAVRLIAHVAAAERLWKVRLDAGAAPVVVWPEWTLDACARALDQIAGEWSAYVPALSAAGLARAIAYVNSKGERWTTSVDDVLAHVVLHSAYHRGQVAYVLRAGGGEPAYTDYAHCVRNGLI